MTAHERAVRDSDESTVLPLFSELELIRFSGRVRAWRSGRLPESIHLPVFGRAQVAEGRVEPLAVVEDLDIQDGGLELDSGATMSASGAGCSPEGRTSSHLAAVVCVCAKPLPSPLLQPSGPWTGAAPVPSARPERFHASATWPPSSGSGLNARRACSGSLDYVGLRGEPPLSCGRCREVSVP